jgi:hypothetical protein
MILHQTSRSRRLGIPGLPHGDRLASGLGRRLDDGYHWFRSVAPGGIVAIDAVLVGPGGTFAISTTGERGRHARRNGHWYRWNRSTESWVPWDAAPVTGARLAGRRLSLYLERAGLSAEVSAVLVPPAETEVEVPRDEAIGVIVEADAERLAGLASAEEVLSQQQVDRIVALLDPRQPLPRLAQAAPGG